MNRVLFVVAAVIAIVDALVGPKINIDWAIAAIALGLAV